MHEDLLQLIWSQGLFNSNNLRTIDNQSIRIESRGVLNHISGPDFSDARIRIEDTLWIGCVEIHTRSSEWKRHNHQIDPAYNNVILHVVYENDADVHNARGNLIPTLELKGLIPSHLIAKYEYLKANKAKVPCSSHVSEVPQIHIRSWLSRLLVMRLERKSADLILMHKMANHDWLQTFYILFAGYLGQNHNKLPFQELARTVPLKLILKYQGQEKQVEALLFGAAGFLNEPHSIGYQKELRDEFNHLKDKHKLTSIAQHWKFGGIRPDAFPTRRIALLAAIIPEIQSIHEKLTSSKYVDFSKLALDTAEFWNDHYSFSKSSEKVSQLNLSSGLNTLLQINVVAPFLFFYGQSTGNQKFIDQAIRLLEELPAEVNAYTKLWSGLGVDSKNAADSQSTIELSTQFCKPKNCVICNIGKLIISNA